MIVLVVLALFAAATGWPATAADTEIGSVTRLQGSATWRSGHADEPLMVGAPVFTNQKVATGAPARLELTFDDETKLTLGDHASMTLDSFVYDPGKSGKLKLAVTGAFRFVSGQISAQPDKELAVTTPFAVIGIRGTNFWAGPIDGQFGVLLVDGAVTVTNAGVTQTLDQPGQGTNIAAPNAPPGAVTLWPQAKVDRALAAVAFQ